MANGPGPQVPDIPWEGWAAAAVQSVEALLGQTEMCRLTHLGVDYDSGNVRLLVNVLDGGLVGIPILQLHLQLLPA